MATRSVTPSRGARASSRGNTAMLAIDAVGMALDNGRTYGRTCKHRDRRYGDLYGRAPAAEGGLQEWVGSR